VTFAQRERGDGSADAARGAGDEHLHRNPFSVLVTGQRSIGSVAPGVLTFRATRRDTAAPSTGEGCLGLTLPRRTISDTFVRLLHDHLDAQGVDAPRLLGRPRPCGEPAVMPLAQWVRLLERAARHLDDPLLGLRVGQRITPLHLGTLGYLLQALPTLGAALHRLERYQRLVYDQTPMRLRAGPGWLALTWGPEQGLPGALADDASIAALLQYCRAIARGPVVPLQVQFIHTAPADTAPYRAFYGCPVEFGAELTSVRLAEPALRLPLQRADAALSALMEQQAERLLAQWPSAAQEAAVVRELRSAAAQLLHEGEPGLAAVAARLGLAPRTVQRHLAQAGTSFRQELETVRRQLAQTYLRDARLSIADVAQLLGYSEHSAFTRSHQQWTGLTPQRWREDSPAALPGC
jgi:AraC-like DNA-binding protein